MKTIKQGKFEAISFNDDIEEYAEVQVKNILSQECYQNYNPKIRLMPDVHPGKVGPIGLTMRIENEAPIMPALLGTDIGCGVSIFKIKAKRGIDLQKLDKEINLIANSKNQYDLPQYHMDDIRLDYNRIDSSFATLGGGNHFIELDKSKNNKQNYLIIHSGSRQYGKQVYDYFMREGQKELKAKGIQVPYEMTYLEGDLKDKYKKACGYCFSFAKSSRYRMAVEICSAMKWNFDLVMTKCHNMLKDIYVDSNKEDNVPTGFYTETCIYKGAQSAEKNEPVIIPINMKEGCILGIGKGNYDWNYGAPHGSGRVYKRSEVANHYTVNQFKKDMKGIYSTSIRKDTLDEAPIAYRSMDQILSLIEPSVEVKEIIYPGYNFKLGKED